MFVVATGNAFDGIKLMGPFSTHDEALEYAEEHGGGDSIG